MVGLPPIRDCQIIWRRENRNRAYMEACLAIEAFATWPTVECRGMLKGTFMKGKLNSFLLLN